MSLHQRSPQRQPVPHLAALDEFQGRWVAVKDEQVVAAAESSRALVAELHVRGIKGTVSQWVPPVDDVTRVGVG